MEPLYTVYFGGEILAGQEPAVVRERLGQLFKTDDKTLERLFNGRLHVVKRGCDRAAALKYKQAMERAGAKPVIKPETAAAVQAPATEKAPDKPLSAAERIAALAAAPDLDAYRGDAANTASAAQETAASDRGINLAPPHSDVLRPEERAPEVHRDVDTGSLAVDMTAERLAAPGPPAPEAPDTSHLSMGEVGDDIPTLPRDSSPPPLDIEAISLAPEGTDFSDCAAPDAPAPALDLSNLDLAPPDSEVLEERYRDRDSPAAPPTDHLQVED